MSTNDAKHETLQCPECRAFTLTPESPDAWRCSECGFPVLSSQIFFADEAFARFINGDDPE